MPSRIELGVPVAGRCSVCHRPFEIEPNDKDSPASIQQELRALFDNHTCDEDFSQAAFSGGPGSDRQGLTVRSTVEEIVLLTEELLKIPFVLFLRLGYSSNSQ